MDLALFPPRPGQTCRSGQTQLAKDAVTGERFGESGNDKAEHGGPTVEQLGPDEMLAADLPGSSLLIPDCIGIALVRSGDDARGERKNRRKGHGMSLETSEVNHSSQRFVKVRLSAARGLALLHPRSTRSPAVAVTV